MAEDPPPVERLLANEHLELYDRNVNQPEGLVDLKLTNQVFKMEERIAAEVERRMKQMALEKQTVAQVQPVQPIQAMNSQQVEEINFLKQNNPYSNTYNPGWKNHPSFSWKDQQGNVPKQGAAPYQGLPQQQQQYRPPQQQPYQQPYQQPQQQFQPQGQRKMSQIAQQMANPQQSGALPSATVSNPKDHTNVSAISTRSGKAKEVVEENAEEEEPLLEVDVEIKENEVEAEDVVVSEPVTKGKIIEPKPAVKLPFPTRNKKKGQHEKNFEKFLEMFKKLELNIPFLEALEQMPTYAKFMKDIISKKRTIDRDPIILTETCSAILQGMKIPVKKKDRGSVTIPCTIGDRSFKKALIDLGASVSLMPLSIYKRLGIGKVQDTRMTPIC
ncbi:mediator of RNA polymerase II transcription subunit 15-like [Vicia villosa]|uniref:mediator of RNA polymerase II transcription subunit 15-like n=1 Tax=Vicia villosa TaxID=3911 RepID=UPI00273A8684|nr:mediator of RNA polymerase II transcription subunit 15-like [Vicia villosa]